ncbi:DNA-binding protein [Bacteroidia bacterium]|nr:DNA-binding protein [Bacteroidia bacterium]
MIDKNEIVLYQPDNSVKLEVRLENETVWLTQAQIGLLFGVDRTVVTKHLKNIFTTGELFENSTCAIFAHMGNDGKQQYQTKFYNLDAILSVGYRVNSMNATLFRRWATGVLKDYILRGYAISQRFERLEYRMTETEKKIDFFVKTALPPVEGVYFDGQIFDAYKFVAELIKRAKKTIILIDNYVDESVLVMLTKRNPGVDATIYTAKISTQLQLDLTRHNAQYPPITITERANIHDRFLLIDNDIYHIGASLKDLGKKLFAFTKMGMKADALMKNIV